MLRELIALTQMAFRPERCWTGPLHVQIEPTNRCNMACVSCPRETIYATYGSMPNELFGKAIGDIKPRTVTFNGLGEQFLDPNVFDKIDCLKKNGCKVNLTSNFSTVTEKDIGAIVDRELELLSISLDAVDSESYRSFRGRDLFETVLSNIERLTQVKAMRGARFPIVRLSYVIHKHSLQSMEAFCHLAKRLGVQSVLFQPIDLPYNPEKRSRLLPEGESEIRNLIRAAIGTCRQLKLPSNLSFLLATFPAIAKKFGFNPGGLPDRKCYAPWFTTYIQVDGTVTPCCSIVGKGCIMGDLRQDAFSRIWSGGAYRKFRNDLRSGRLPAKACEGCVPFNVTDLVGRVKWTPALIH